MALRRTYFLAPDFEQKPSSSSIQLGVLLSDPLKPNKPLSIPSFPPASTTTVHTAYTLSRTSGKSANAGVWANFLSIAETNVGTDNSSDVTQSFEIDSLETIRLQQEPQDDDPDLLARLQEQKVQAAIRSGLFGARSVYMITGLKIARGLSVQREESKSNGGTVGGSVPIVEGISAGAEIGGEKRFGTSSGFKMAPEEDIIFAYQVYKVKPKGKKASGAAVDIYQSDAAFLHGDDGENGEVTTNGAEVAQVSKDNLDSADESDSEEEDERQMLEIEGDDGELYILPA